MAKFKNGRNSILDCPSGKVGPVIFYEWRGIGCVRKMPECYHDARTDAQLKNRCKMGTLMKFESTLTGALQNGFKHVADNTSEVNEATRINFRTAMVTEGTSARMEYSQTYLSWGPLPGMIGLQWMTLNGRVLTRWESAACFDPRDKVCMALFNEDKGLATWNLNCGTRGDLGCGMDVPEEWSGDKVHCWIWVNGDGRNSISQYLGEFRIENLEFKVGAGAGEEFKTENSEFRVGAGAGFEASTGDSVTTWSALKCYLGATRPAVGLGPNGAFEGVKLGVEGWFLPPGK